MQAGWETVEFASLYAEHSRSIFYLALRISQRRMPKPTGQEASNQTTAGSGASMG